jgi:hypothetical protein
VCVVFLVRGGVLLVRYVGCRRLCADAARVCQLTGTVIEARGEGMLGRDVCVRARELVSGWMESWKNRARRAVDTYIRCSIDFM